MTGPSDDDILAIVAEFPDGVQTYVVHGALERDGKGPVTRRRVKAQLRWLERHGKLERVTGAPVSQAEWRLPRG